MRSSTYYSRHSREPILSPLVMVALASFLLGFGGYLLFGLSALN